MSQPEATLREVSAGATDYDHSADKRVIRQLLEALLFEQLVPYVYRDGRLDFRIGDVSYSATGAISSFSRVRIDANSIQCDKGVPNLNAIVEALPGADEVKQQLLKELQQTAALCEWNRQHLQRFLSRRHLSYTQLESEIDEGHPYHPCFKARTGFSTDDHAQYGPEAGNTFRLHWLAIRRCYLHQQLPAKNEDTFWQAEIGEDNLAALKQRMVEQQIDWQSYGLMPVHPWQWRQLCGELREQTRNRDIVFLGAAGDFYQATISVRTLINVSEPRRANIKLPMNMVSSSSMRIMPAHSVRTAPTLSRWLCDTVEGDTFFQQRQALGLLPEYASIALIDKPDSWTQKLADQLSVIFRESVDKNSGDATAIPFVALALIEDDGLPFIDPWIQHYGCQPWLRQLFDVFVIPLWHLLVHHGIALEAHAQNLILQHRSGWPQKIIARDFHESLEYVESFLAAPKKVPDFKAMEMCYREGEVDHYFWMQSIESLRELLVDTLFVFNLSELAVVLEHHHHYSETDFWQLLKSRLDFYARAGFSDPARIAQIDISAPQIKTESLMRKKLSGEVDREFHHDIDNALASP